MRVESGALRTEQICCADIGLSRKVSVLPLRQGVELEHAAFVPQPGVGVSYAAQAHWGGVGGGLAHGALDFFDHLGCVFGRTHPAQPGHLAELVYLDLQQAQALLDLPGGVTVIDTTIEDLFQANAIAQRLRALTGLKTESWMETNGDLLNALSSQSMSTQMIRIFVAISVAFGIASVLAVSVVQRTREIGILRAMGSRRQQILRVFLLQGAVLGFMGSLVGGAAGYGLVQIFNILGPRLFVIPFDPWLIPSAIALATTTGILAAAAPARRAARYDPAVAIRYV